MNPDPVTPSSGCATNDAYVRSVTLTRSCEKSNQVSFDQTSLV